MLAFTVSAFVLLVGLVLVSLPNTVASVVDIIGR